MSREWPAEGTIYTETIVYTAPERYLADAPYQLAIIETRDHQRFTVRIVVDSVNEKANVGEQIRFAEERDGVAYYRRVRSV
ncbi:MAG: hypothetical protein JWP08_3531 [Bryobacterales bacterium]|jgi:uncharacterized OB-fold protein|nr:hypothetical protein [Bryobacterales bacterium]